MKKFSPILAFFFMALTIQAQSPQKLNYQGVARQASGQVIPDQAISLRASILDGSPSGLSQYVEQHTVTTNQLGLFTASIGGGTVLTGSFANITWGSGDKYLKIEIDPAGGSNYSLTGVFQLLSVPYSLQSRNAEQIQGNPVSPTPPLDGQVLLWDENAGEWISADAAQSLVYTAGAGININASNVISNTAPDQTVTITGQGVTTVSGSYPNFTVNTPAPADNSPTNEIQTLSLSGNTLSLSNGGGSVTLNNGANYNAGAGIDISGNVISNTGDLSNINEIQTLMLSGSNLSLTGGGSVILPDASATNEIQTISLTGSTLSLSNGGGSVTLPPEVDGSVTNEIQTLSLSGNTLSLSNGGGSVTLNNGANYNAGAGIDISGNVITNTGDLSNANEIQTLSLSGSNLSLTGGGSVILPDASATNEIQTISLTGSTLSLSNGGGSVTLPPDQDAQTLAIAGQTLSISNGNSVGLPAEVDGSVTNEIQTLSLSGADLTLSNGGGTVTLPTGTTYTAGNGIGISGNVISNTGDLSAVNEIQTISLGGDTISLSNGGGSVILPEEVDGSVTNEIQSLSLNGDTLSLSNGGGSVLLPSGQIYTAGSGISIDGNNVISNTGDVVAADDINIGTTAGGDLSGVYPNPVVDGLQGKPVSPAIPSASQVLQWNGTAWAPATLPAAPAGWLLSGNAGTNPSTHFIGTTDNQDLVFKRNNLIVGRITVLNQAFGAGALASTTTGNSNCAFGGNALAYTTTGTNNIAIGFSTLFVNTTGSNNTAIGGSALFGNSTGFNNTATGAWALHNNTTGSYNTAAGYFALANNYTGFQNTASGFEAMHLNDTGGRNTATGTGALRSNSSGSDNTAAGFDALVNNTTGFQNSAFGINTLTSNTTGSYNTAIGTYANVASGNYSNANAIGNSATANASNKIRLGNTNITVIEGQVAYSWPSDARFKFNVEEEVIGLDFIKRLRPVNYQFDTRKFEEFLTQNMPDSIRRYHFEGVDFSASTGIVHTGFIAQEVEQAARESGYAFDGVHAPTDGNDNYSMAYSQFVVPLVKAVQEQQEMIEQLEQKNEAQNDEIAQLKAELQEIRALLMAKSN
ncbi:MAG: tail fiber domain-containing protein [Saprospiraceae bacterium]